MVLTVTAHTELPGPQTDALVEMVSATGTVVLIDR